MLDDNETHYIDDICGDASWREKYKPEMEVMGYW